MLLESRVAALVTGLVLRTSRKDEIVECFGAFYALDTSVAILFDTLGCFKPD
jgi:hypothetical protein